jgi:ribosomal protein S18 acetylase RimI-like enzyme
MSVQVRSATPADLNKLLEFEQAIIEAERPFDETIRTGPDVHYYYLEVLLTSPDVEIVVAELDSEIVGSGYARIKSSQAYYAHDKHSYLGFMYVVPEQRGKSVNKKIIDALESWSAARGIKEMQLKVYVNNVGAIKAYEKSDYQGVILTMRKELRS